MGKAFLGKGWSFPPRFDPRTKGLVMVEDVEDIEESLRILFSTEPGERVLQPGYGCGLRPFVFELISEQTLREIRDVVSRAVLFYEPRVFLDRIDAESPDGAEGRVLLKLDYRVRTTNTRHNMVFPLYLRQATNPVTGS